MPFHSVATPATAFCFSERLSNPSNASAGLSKATLAATRPSHLFLRAFKPAVCPASNASNASAGLSKATLAATRHLFLRAFKPAVCPASNASNAPAGLSKATFAATRPRHLFLRAFKPAVCPASNASNASAGLSKATLAATRPSHLFLRAFKPAVCLKPFKRFKPFRRPFHGNSRSYTPRHLFLRAGTVFGFTFIFTSTFGASPYPVFIPDKTSLHAGYRPQHRLTAPHCT